MPELWETEKREPELLEIVDDFPPQLLAALYQALFRPSETYGEPDPEVMNHYRFITPAGNKGPISMRHISRMLKLKWIEPLPDGYRCHISPEKAKELLDRPHGLARRTLRGYFKAATGQRKRP